MAITRNRSRHSSPTKEDEKEFATSSEGSIKNMLVMLLEKMDGVDRRVNEMQGNINIVQGEFTMLHEDVVMLRDQVGHGLATPSLNREEARSMHGGRRHEVARSNAAFSGRPSEDNVNDVPSWQGNARRRYHDNGRRGGHFERRVGHNRGHGNYERHDRDRYNEGREEVRYDDPCRNFKHTPGVSWKV